MSLRQKLPVAIRTLLGLIFFVFGLNGFLQFLPMPELPAQAGAFMGGLAAAGYFFPLLKGTEVLMGALLLSGKYVPLALTVLAPITLNIVAFHVFLTPGSIGLSVAMLAMHLYLAWSYRQAYTGVLAADARPVSSSAAVTRAATALG